MSRHAASRQPPLADAPPRFDWRDWLAFVGSVLGTALLVSLVLAAVVLIVSTQANAQTQTQTQTPAPAPAPGDPAIERLPGVASAHDSDRGALLFRTTQGLKAAPLQKSDMHIEVTGPVVRATVTQTFHNPGRDWLEGLYVFPLPDDGAVDRLRMHVGERIVEGRIRERDAARRQYREAAAAGHGASLVEQQRPNLFTARVANIAPGARIAIRIEYQQTLALKDGVWRLRLPTVVAPRYDPDGSVLGPGVTPLLLPAAAHGAEDAVNPVAITVRLDAGVPVTTPVSSTHAIRVRSAAPYLHEIALAGGAVADRDFELEWAPKPGTAPAAAFRTERLDDAWYGLLVLAPPLDAHGAQARLPRETTFVIDTSGSMAGASFEQALRALRFGLAQLRPGDSFNVIRFANSHSSLYPAPRPFDETSRREALAWIERLRAEGGTEMRGAIEQALGAPAAPGRVAQVVFMTDGAVGYEADMLTLIERRLGARRFFTVGIGSAPNGWFMRKAAAAGRGSYTYIGRVEEVERRMGELYAKLAHPMVGDLQLRFEGAQPLEAVALPGELYAGEPVVVQARFASAPSAAIVSGTAGGIRWESRVPAAPGEGSGLHAAWARQRIETLGDEIARASGDAASIERLRAQVRDLGLAHHLVTAYTSLVAVDVTPARPADAPLTSTTVPTHLPDGWELEAVLGQGELAQGATPAALHVAAGLLLLALALLPALAPALRARLAAHPAGGAR